MKFKSKLIPMLFLLILVSLNACSIEGEQICGVWLTDSDTNQMKIEITPWQGKFYGYLLEYRNGSEIEKGGKNDEDIFITDLTFQDSVYKNGKIYLNVNSEEYCDFSLELIDENHIKSKYLCRDYPVEEFWTRLGHEPLVEVKKITQLSVKEVEGNNGSNESSEVNAEDKNLTDRIPHPIATGSFKDETKKGSEFFVIGYHEVVDYNDAMAMESAIERLWLKIYDDDFSGRLNNIIDQVNMYSVYSSYDKPKGKMTINIGYKVRNLNNIPSGLKGVTIPANEFLVYPLSGNESDFEGEGWSQLEELMTYRKSEAVDFEVYAFDNNYEVTSGEIWIATK